MSAAAPVTKVVAAIDLGTTSTRCMLFDHQGRMVAIAQIEQRQSSPAPGWAEQNAAELWHNVTRVVPEALRRAGLGLENVAALGIANQRETTVIWDRRTGHPLAPAITWQDTRSERVVEQLRDRAAEIRAVTGLPLAAYFAAPRLRWLLDHVAGAREEARRGRVLFGTMEAWLIWNLTGGPRGGIHVTDATNASRTLLLDLRRRSWSTQMLDLMDIPAAMLPRIVDNSEVYGTCSTVLPGVPISAAIGDQQAALFGQTCFATGEAKCTYGTGAFLLVNAGTDLPEPGHGLVPTIAYSLPGSPVVYALEGPIAMTGSLVQWFRDNLGLIGTAPQIETLAARVPDSGGCYIVPAFSGLYAPHWDAQARGLVVGLTSYVTKAHLARAVLEATAWQTYDVVAAVRAATPVPLQRLLVDGGMTANHLLMQFLADVLGLPVERPFVAETVSLGAAYAAGLAVEYWTDLDALRRNHHIAAAWRPRMVPAERSSRARMWAQAVQRARVSLPGPDVQSFG